MQATLKLLEFNSVVSINTPSEPWRGRALKTTCPEHLMLLLSIALEVCTFLIIYELHEYSKGVSSHSLGSATGTYNNSDHLSPIIVVGADS